MNLMHPDYLRLIQSMPRTADGMVKDVKYVPENQRAAYLQQWRVWAKEHPDRTKWPQWLQDLAKIGRSQE